MCGSMCLSDADAMTARHMLLDLYDAFKLDSSNMHIKWECLLIFRKLTLVCATTFIIHPIGKLYTVLVLLTTFSFQHYHVQPYANKTLNVVESCSLALLGLMASVNLFWAYNYMSNELNFPQFFNIAEMFLYFEIVVLVLPIIIIIGAAVLQVGRKVFYICMNRINRNDL